MHVALGIKNVGKLILGAKSMHAVVLGMVYPRFYGGNLILTTKTMHAVV